VISRGCWPFSEAPTRASSPPRWRTDDEKAFAVHIIGNVADKRALLFDDEIATGGTILEATDILLKNGAKDVEAVAVHPVLSGTAVERLASSKLTRLTVTDSIPIPEMKRANVAFTSKLSTISVAALLADAISRIHDGRSVSQLFR
jgi:ribose-phosphate pyrophosphokinase